MDPTLRELIDHSTFHKGTVRAVAALLPASDAELDALVGETVAHNDIFGFLFVLTAALDTARRVDVRHMVKAASMTGDHHRFTNLVWKMDGDIPGALIGVIKRGGIPHEHTGVALLLTAVWCRDHKGGALPDEFLPEAKALARNKNLRREVQAVLQCIAQIVNDAALNTILQLPLYGEAGRPVLDALQKVTDAILDIARRPVMEMVVDAPPRHVAAGVTMRRAVEKLGRNDDCHCGSGKKYKRCCFDKDQERLHLSTAVAGKTHAELRDAPETGLTIHRLEKMQRYELAQLDPFKIPEVLHINYIMRAVSLGLYEPVVEYFERAEWTDESPKRWYFTAFFLMRAEEKELAARMIAVAERNQSTEKLRDGFRLLVARDDPAEELRLLARIASAILKETDPERLSEHGHDLLYSRHKALGILVSRSLIPLIPTKEGSSLLNEILRAHDKLNLPPDDPYSDILEKRIAEETGDDGKDAAELRTARKRLDAKAAEVRTLKEDIEHQRRAVHRHEKQTQAPTPAHEAELKDLRQQLTTLKAPLPERAEERTGLRRELEKARDVLEATRSKAAAPAPEDHADDEARHYLPEQPSGNQPLRIIEFPPKFRESLDDFPQHIARAALAMAGRLAGGEPAAFSGVVALKAIPGGMYRQRIGIDHRLLFRLHPDRVQLFALINRRDLDRKIKILRA